MKQADIWKMAEKFQAKADKAFQNYQETGLTRYDTEYQRNDDVAAALRVAAGAADTATALVSIKGDLHMLGNAAARHITNESYKDPEKMRVFLADIVAVARTHGLYCRELE